MRYIVTQVAQVDRLLEVEADSGNEAYAKALEGEYNVRRAWRVNGPPQNVMAMAEREYVSSTEEE